MKTRALIVVAFAGMLMLPVAVFAHHGYAAYEQTRISLKGKVTRFVMMNPHSVIEIDVTDEQGNVQHWVVETGHVRAMKAGGWKPTSLKPGDEATFTFRPARNGSRIGSGGRVVFADGTTLPRRSPDGEGGGE
jgi:hypothetical protein